MEALAKLTNTTASQINKLEKGERRLTDQWMHRLAAALDCGAADLLLAPGASTGTHPSAVSNQSRTVGIPEVDVRAGAGAGGLAGSIVAPDGNGGTVSIDETKGNWGLPDEYVRGELHVRPSEACIIEVKGDSMNPTLHAGDRVMVDTGDRTPSPPGVFAIWDGFGVVSKRIEIVPNTEPTELRIKSDNAHHDDYVRTAEEVSVIGRIVWVARRI